MAKGGKYLKKKAPAGRRSRVGLIVLLVIILLLTCLIGGGIWYYNHVLSMISRPEDVQLSIPTMSPEEEAAMLGIVTEPTVETTVETRPEDTWPVIESDENLTHIMLVGQAARYGEEYRLSDTMILCTINRETKTLTMTSFLRDLRVIVPAYAGHGQGRNKMNVCYHLGSYYTGEARGSMEMLALCVEQNFGIKVDHTVEVDFEIFQKVVDMLGGVEVELTEAEATHLMATYDDVGELTVGRQTLNGIEALRYARLRKIDNDFNRTNRQRNVIMSLLSKLKTMGIMDVHALFTEIMPMILTDMTNEEITNYAFEFIPMLADLNIVSQSIPYEGTYWYANAGTEEAPNYVIDANMKANIEMFWESIGVEAPAE